MDEQNEFEEIIRERCFPGREDLESCFFTSYSYTPNEYFKSINEKEEETKQEKCSKCKMNPMLRDLCLKDTVLDQDGWEVAILHVTFRYLTLTKNLQDKE